MNAQRKKCFSSNPQRYLGAGHDRPYIILTKAIKVILLLCLIWLINAKNSFAQGDSTSTPTPPPGTTLHVVQNGESLFEIAQQYGTTVDAIAQANGISNVTIIKVGQRLLIPDGAMPSGNPELDYMLQAGDSLPDLALRYGVPVQTLMQRNKILNPVQVYAGLSLDLQSSTPLIKSGSVYIAQPDDNLYRVAMRYGVTLAALNKANHLDLDTVLFPGQHLIIPGKDSDSAFTDVPTPFTHIVVQPLPAQQGRTVMFQIGTAVSAKISGTFMGKPITAFSDDANEAHIVLFGIDAFAVPNVYPLDLTVVDNKTGQVSQFKYNIAVADGNYGSETIILPPDQIDLLDPKVTQPELDHVLSIVSKFSPKRYFNGLMGLPVPAPVSSQFGTRRSYDNGPFDQFHTGTDFAGAPGSPIYAPADGVVVMTELLHVRGNATIIDHGWGVYTGYWHQTEIKVKVGDIVKQGQVIGLIGSTGRATGPHLHWEMFVDGVQVDPLQWVRESFP